MNVALHPQHLLGSGPGRPQSVNIISLCTGGGGLDLGLELALPTARSVVMVEREAFSVAHLVAAIEQGLLAPAAIWSDVRTFDGRPWRGLVDGLIGGIPCQSHSFAGKKRGSLDERDLWSPTRRIVATARPWFVLIENVSGMLSAGDDEVAGAERVRRDLLKLGFAVEGGLFQAREVGASHERERLFILGVDDPISGGRPARRDDHASDDWHQSGATGSHHLADTGGPRLQGSQQRGASGERDGSASPRPAAELRSARLGHANSKPEFEPNHEDGAQSWIEPRDSTGGPGIGLFPPPPSDRAGWIDTLDRAPHLEPAFRGVADGLASHVDQLRMLGNGVVPLQAAYAFRTLVSRLAATGHAGAAELARLMGSAE